MSNEIEVKVLTPELAKQLGIGFVNLTETATPESVAADLPHHLRWRPNLTRIPVRAGEISVGECVPKVPKDEIPVTFVEYHPRSEIFIISRFAPAMIMAFGGLADSFSRKKLVGVLIPAGSLITIPPGIIHFPPVSATDIDGEMFVVSDKDLGITIIEEGLEDLVLTKV